MSEESLSQSHLMKQTLQEKLGDLFRRADFGGKKNALGNLNGSQSTENTSGAPSNPSASKALPPLSSGIVPSFKKRPLSETQQFQQHLLNVPVASKPSSAHSYIKQETKDTTGLPKSSILFSADNDSLLRTRDWKPKFVIETDRFKEQVTLLTKDVKSLKDGNQFVLESQYTLSKMVHRSFLQLLDAKHFGYTFLFYWPLSQSGFLAELAGLRMSSYTEVRELKTGEKWELHLKAVQEGDGLIYGYLLKPAEIQKMAQEQASAMLQLRKLPLILDLDDTLVRLVSDQPGRYVPEHQAPLGDLVADRLRTLQDGRRVLIADKLEEFLEWAQQFFEVSICSLGDQTYVDMVVEVIDPQRTRIRGPCYSARLEYSYLMLADVKKDRQRLIRKRPPKDTRALYSFCEFPGDIPLEPLIVDDNLKWWNQDQWDSLIVVRKCEFDKIWNVNFFPVVVKALEEVHGLFFKKYDAFMLDREANDVPSMTACYKSFLRRELSVKIAGTVHIPVANEPSSPGDLAEDEDALVDLTKDEEPVVSD